MRKFLFTIAVLISNVAAFAGDLITVKFTGYNVKTENYVQLDSVIVTNLSHDWQQTIYFPDTVMEFLTPRVGVEQISAEIFTITDFRSNPFDGIMQFSVLMPQAGTVNFAVNDLSGRNIIKVTEKLPAGISVYELSLQQPENYILVATSLQGVSSVKLQNQGSSSKNSLRCIANASKEQSLLKSKLLVENSFSPNDNLQYCGYATVDGNLYVSQCVQKKQTEDEIIVLQFEICEKITSEFSQIAYDTFEWNNVFYTKSGDYEQTLVAKNGCDSVVRLHLTLIEHQYVNLGTGALWAICNVGASNTQDYGDYFQWGEVEPHDLSTQYNWANYKYGKSKTAMEKYCTKSVNGKDGFVDGLTRLEPEDDAAHVNWGGEWRMPTEKEFNDLLGNKDIEWQWQNADESNGLVAGYKGVSKVKGCEGAEIFLPAAGSYDGSDGLIDEGIYGYYWTSDLSKTATNMAQYIWFDKTKISNTDDYNRCAGSPIRPMINVKPQIITNSPENLTQNSVVVGGQIEVSGMAQATEYGICWSNEPNPTIENNKLVAQTPQFEFTIDNLQANKTYNYRTFAVNQFGTFYGNEKSFSLTSISESACDSYTHNNVTYNKSGDYIVSNDGQTLVVLHLTILDNCHQGHAYIDLGLPSGMLWATENIGAKLPEEYGNFYSWGEVASKETYSWDSEGDYRWGVFNGANLPDCGMTKYNGTDNKLLLEPEDDAARVNWGGEWRMPTIKEVFELFDNCDCYWLDAYNGTTAGVICKGKKNGFTDKSIFLPATGWRDGTSSLSDKVYCNYWTASRKLEMPPFKKNDELYDMWREALMQYESYTFLVPFLNVTRGQSAPDSDGRIPLGLGNLFGETVFCRAFGLPVRAVMSAQQIVRTAKPSNITLTSAVIGGQLLSNPIKYEVIEYGLCWSTAENPSIADNKLIATTDDFEFTLNDLQCGITYNVRAYAKTSTETMYGEQESFRVRIATEFTKVACGSFTWNDQTYTKSGDYTQLFTAENGCDSLVTAHVIVGDCHQGHVYVDLGLPSGTLWSATNLGSENPEDLTAAFAWGETTPLPCVAMAEIHSWCDNYVFGTADNLTKYNNIDNKLTLEPEDDAATVNWGGLWRMPTVDEMRELTAYCRFTLIGNYNGNNVGHLVTSNVNGNTIFLPMRVTTYDEETNMYGGVDYYWTSSRDKDNPNKAMNFGLEPADMDINSNEGERCGALLVRPVFKK